MTETAAISENKTPASWLSPRVALWLTPVLLVLGVECWLVEGGGNYGHRHQPLLILGAIVCGLIPPIAAIFERLWKTVQHPSPGTRRIIAIVICIGSSLFLYWSQRYEHTPFRPKFQDEFSYLIQMHMLEHGRLWMPALPLPEYFDTFYVIVRPVYASMYFPGTAIMYVPALVLNLPYFVAPLIASGLCAGLLYVVITEVLDGACGLLAMVILLSMRMFRMMSIMAMSQTPTLLLGLTMIWAILQWRKSKRSLWLLVFGAAVGWAAITRPAEALCFAIALACVIASEMCKKSWQSWAKAAAWIVIPAIPFLAIQLIANRNITGRWFTTPFGMYTDLNYPGAFGFHHGSAPVHVSNIPEKQLFYQEFVKGVNEQHQFKNLISWQLHGEWAAVSTAGMPDPFFWLIVPMSILGFWKKELWAVWGVLPFYLVILCGYSFAAVLPHYVIVILPATILLCLLPIRVLTDIFPRRSAMIHTMTGLAMVALALVDMPLFDRTIHDQYFETPQLRAIEHVLDTKVSPPAVVMFHFNRGANVSEEPVFNSDVAWPDDAPIIRVHDLNPKILAIGKSGDRDRPLYEYYARIDPKRVFYLFDRGQVAPLKRLGTAEEMVSRTRPAYDGR